MTRYIDTDPIEPLKRTIRARRSQALSGQGSGEDMTKNYEREHELYAALEDMVAQFAYHSQKNGQHVIHTGGLSALEGAFAALGYDDPHRPKWLVDCDVPGCLEKPTCGTPTPDGYKTLCGEHYREEDKKQRAKRDDA